MRVFLLKGEHVGLSVPTEEDLADLVLWNDPEYRVWGSTPGAVVLDPPPERMKRAREFWRRGEPYFSITTLEGEFLGFLLFTRFVSGYELHMALLRERGKGYGTEATKLALVWAFAVKGVPAVVLLVRKDNARARRSYEKAGFQELGTIPRLLRLGLREVDMVLYFAQRDEWLKERRDFVVETLRRSGYDAKALGVTW